MGKSGGSWFAAIKRAFMSPAQKRICGSRYDIGPEEHKGRGRKRFQKQTISVTATASDSAPDDAFAAAMATAAAAQAAVASAKAALEALPLAYQPSTYLRDHRAATTIQAVFRGYLARRALNALKGLVKLQALVRGQNVRRQAEMTLRSVQAMVRLQGQMRDQRTSHLFMNDINIRRASTEHTVRRNDAALHCDNSHVSTLLQQDKLWSQDGEWMTRKQRSSPSRSSFDQRDMIKTIEIDTYRPYSVSKDIQHAMLCSPRGSVPHYMSATESTKARIRSQSAPRQRAMTPERDRTRGTKKRLSSPIPDPSIYKTSLGHFLEHEELGWANNAYPTKPML